MNWTIPSVIVIIILIIWIKKLLEKVKKLKSTIGSQSYDMGRFVEELVPIQDFFKYDRKSLNFLGKPIDYIAFDYTRDEIVFIEVKSGNSQLSDNQRKVKDMVERNKVRFEVMRV